MFISGFRPGGADAFAGRLNAMGCAVLAFSDVNESAAISVSICQFDRSNSWCKPSGSAL